MKVAHYHLIPCLQYRFSVLWNPKEAQFEDAQVGNPNTSQAEENRCTDD
jgi:hypothetical protein